MVFTERFSNNSLKFGKSFRYESLERKNLNLRKMVSCFFKRSMPNNLANFSYRPLVVMEDRSDAALQRLGDLFLEDVLDLLHLSRYLALPCLPLPLSVLKDSYSACTCT